MKHHQESAHQTLIALKPLVLHAACTGVGGSAAFVAWKVHMFMPQLLCLITL